MKIFFSVGEPSGDLHGANLIRRLKLRDSSIECLGLAGPKMEQAGCRLLADLTSLAVMGFVRVLGMLPQFWRMLQIADRCFREERPDAVVLIDFPGFNWWIARRAKKHGIPVFYYGVPQMWAWAGWRVRKMRRLVDHVLCKLPFEQRWFHERGCEAIYVGHPYFDEMEQQQLDADFLARYGNRPGPLVTILPGSRTHEVTDNLRWLLKAAAIVHRRVPQVRFAIAAFREDHADTARAAVTEAGLPIDVFAGRTPDLIHLAHCTMACSGSVSLELLHHRKPTVIVYWVPRIFYWLAMRFFIKVKYVTLVNLLADPEPFADRPAPYDPHAPDAERVPFPEYPTYQDKSHQIAAHLVEWLTDRDAYAARVRQLDELKQRYAQSGASQRAADYILKQLKADDGMYSTTRAA
jgi:lipid-A-disaccharide synthase